MSTSVYSINKGINRPIEFRGLRAQYIGWLGAGLLGLLILFVILYSCGVHTFACLGVTVVLGTALFIRMYKLSRKYGQHGMMKAIARRSVPATVKNYSRKTFTGLARS